MTIGESPAFSITYPSGDKAVGEVVAIDRPHRVVYSWGYRDGRHGLAPGASRVEIALEPTAVGTRVRLRHTGLPTQPLRDAHRQGWLFYLGTLAARASDRQTQDRLPRLLESWSHAWNTADVNALLACCGDDVEYLDRMAAVRGREALGCYIRNARSFAPGATLTIAGIPSIAQRYARFRWEMRDGGSPLGAGMAFAELTPQGLFSRVISFWD